MGGFRLNQRPEGAYCSYETDEQRGSSATQRPAALGANPVIR